MTRKLTPVLAALAMIIAVQANASPDRKKPTTQTTTQTSKKQTKPKQITVYVTNTGSKYHRDGCRYLNRSRIPISLEDAKKSYSPCSVCDPPE